MTDKQNQTKIFYRKCVRVWKTLKKPSKQEFTMTSKISAIGIVILGFIGFVISFVMKMSF